MKLVDLEPAWVIPGKVFIFRSPTGKGDWLLCKNIPMPVHDQITMMERFFKSEYPFAGDTPNGKSVVPMNEGTCWNIQGDNFETMTVTPSIDASASGNWHGHITDGNIVGGLRCWDGLKPSRHMQRRMDTARLSCASIR